MDDDSDFSHQQPSVLSRFFRSLSQRYQLFLDATTPYSSARWVSTVLFAFIYISRIIYIQGYYVVTYALGIYHLNLFIAFLTPQIDPELNFENESDDGPSLPSRSNDEFRPFIRRLAEFKFWHSATKGILIAFTCTFFEALDVPVFWPILVLYFILLFGMMMKRQIKHMIKYRYIPFTFGKPKHRGRPMDAMPGNDFRSK